MPKRKIPEPGMLVQVRKEAVTPDRAWYNSALVRNHGWLWIIDEVEKRNPPLSCTHKLRCRAVSDGARGIWWLKEVRLNNGKK